MLIDPSKLGELKEIAKRERCPLSIVGKVDGHGRVVLTKFGDDQSNSNQMPVDLDLKAIGSRENKVPFLFLYCSNGKVKDTISEVRSQFPCEYR